MLAIRAILFIARMVDDKDFYEELKKKKKRKQAVKISALPKLFVSLSVLRARRKCACVAGLRESPGVLLHFSIVGWAQLIEITKIKRREACELELVGTHS